MEIAGPGIVKSAPCSVNRAAHASTHTSRDGAGSHLSHLLLCNKCDKCDPAP